VDLADLLLGAAEEFGQLPGEDTADVAELEDRYVRTGLADELFGSRAQAADLPVPVFLVVVGDKIARGQVRNPVDRVQRDDRIFLLPVKLGVLQADVPPLADLLDGFSQRSFQDLGPCAVHGGEIGTRHDRDDVLEAASICVERASLDVGDHQGQEGQERVGSRAGVRARIQVLGRDPHDRPVLLGDKRVRALEESPVMGSMTGSMEYRAVSGTGAVTWRPHDLYGIFSPVSCWTSQTPYSPNSLIATGSGLAAHLKRNVLMSLAISFFMMPELPSVSLTPWPVPRRPLKSGP
jgi:hypothetical protein